MTGKEREKTPTREVRCPPVRNPCRASPQPPTMGRRDAVAVASRQVMTHLCWNDTVTERTGFESQSAHQKSTGDECSRPRTRAAGGQNFHCSDANPRRSSFGKWNELQPFQICALPDVGGEGGRVGGQGRYPVTSTSTLVELAKREYRVILGAHHPGVVCLNACTRATAAMRFSTPNLTKIRSTCF